MHRIPPWSQKRRMSPRVRVICSSELKRPAGKVHAITGDITYRKIDSVLGRTEIRTGNFAYESPTDSQSERMGVMFDQLIVNNVRRERQREYLFGRHLADRARPSDEDGDSSAARTRRAGGIRWWSHSHALQLQQVRSGKAIQDRTA